MKSEKGVTITSLIIYIGIFFIVVLLVGRITSFLYKNSDSVDKNTYEADFNKLNLYIVEEAKKENNYIYSIGSMQKNNDSYEFKNSQGNSAIKFVVRKDGKDTEFNTIGLIDKSIYYNNAKVCSNVKGFTVIRTIQNNKDKLSIEVTFENDKKFNTEYIMRNQSEN